MVYTLAGIASEYMKKDKSWKIMQRRGGSDCCEFGFAAFFLSNSNGTEYDIRGIDVQRSAFLGHNVSSSFSHIFKSNFRQGNRVGFESLTAKVIKRYLSMLLVKDQIGIRVRDLSNIP